MNIRKKTVVVWGALLAMVLGTAAASARMHILTGPPPPGRSPQILKHQ